MALPLRFSLSECSNSMPTYRISESVSTADAPLLSFLICLDGCLKSLPIGHHPPSDACLVGRIPGFSLGSDDDRFGYARQVSGEFGRCSLDLRFGGCAASHKQADP